MTSLIYKKFISIFFEKKLKNYMLKESKEKIKAFLLFKPKPNKKLYFIFEYSWLKTFVRRK